MVFFGLMIGELALVAWLSGLVGRLSSARGRRRLPLLLGAERADALGGLPRLHVRVGGLDVRRDGRDVRRDERLRARHEALAGRPRLVRVHGAHRRDSRVRREHFPPERHARVRRVLRRRDRVHGAHGVRHEEAQGMAMAVDGGSEEGKRGAISGALALYLDFINLFLMLLRLFGTGGRPSTLPRASTRSSRGPCRWSASPPARPTCRRPCASGGGRAPRTSRSRRTSSSSAASSSTSSTGSAPPDADRDRHGREHRGKPRRHRVGLEVPEVKPLPSPRGAEAYLAIDKPAGVAVHGPHGLIGPLRKEFGDNLALVHRLDKETSGVLLLAERPKRCPPRWKRGPNPSRRRTVR